MSIKKVYLSPSNQIGNMYAGVSNVSECDSCNRIADYAKSALERCGFEVKKAPKGQDMYETIDESNAWGSDLHIPIHTNAMNGAIGGTVVFVYANATENLKIAKPIYEAVQEVSPGTTNFGIREYPQLAELSGTTAIAVYIEVDFHDVPSIAKWLVQNPQIVGEAICRGVCKAAGVEYKSTVDPVAMTDDDYAEIERAMWKTYEGKARSYIAKGITGVPAKDISEITAEGYSVFVLNYFIKKITGGG